MALNKKQEFRPEDQNLSEFAKALAHPARIAILRVLAEKRSCICGEIVEILPLAQSTVSQHLKELKNAGLIQGIISGPKTCYCLNHEEFTKFEKALSEMFGQMQQPKSDCC